MASVRASMEASFLWEEALIEASLPGERNPRKLVEAAGRIALERAKTDEIKAVLMGIVARRKHDAAAARRHVPPAEARAKDRAMERASIEELVALATARVQALPTPEEYAAFYAEEIQPAFDRTRGTLARCKACGKPFRRRKGKAFCSPECGARPRSGRSGRAGTAARKARPQRP